MNTEKLHQNILEVCKNAVLKIIFSVPGNVRRYIFR